MSNETKHKSAEEIIELAETLLRSINAADPLKADLLINDLRKQCRKLVKSLRAMII